MGKIPFVSASGCVASCRAFDRLFIFAGCAELTGKLIGMDPGVTVAMNGGTRMPFEDLAPMRTVPGLTVAEPSGAVSWHRFCAENGGA
jgi:transketolase